MNFKTTLWDYYLYLHFIDEETEFKLPQTTTLVRIENGIQILEYLKDVPWQFSVT